MNFQFGNEFDTSEGRDINDTGEMAGGSQVSGGQFHAMYKAANTGKNIGWVDLGLLPAGAKNAFRN